MSIHLVLMIFQFASKGLMPGYLIIYPFVPEVGDLLRAGLHDLTRVELHAREIVIGEGGRDVSRLILVMGKPPQASHLGSFHLPATPNRGAQRSGVWIALVHLAFCLFKLFSDEPFHLDVIIVVKFLGVDLPLMDTLSDFHDRSNAKLPLHLLLGDAPTDSSAQCRRVSGNNLGPAIDKGLVGVSPIALAA